MTGPVPPPLPPAAVSPIGQQPLAEGSLAPGQHRPGASEPTRATVVSLTRQGPLIEAAGQRFLMRGGPPLPAGASLTLDLAGAGRQRGSGHVLAIGGRALEPPVMVRLQAVPPPASVPGPADSGQRLAAGIQVEARLLGPDGRPAGAPIPIRLTAIGEPAPGSHRSATGAPAGAGSQLGGQAAAGGALTAEILPPDPAGRLLLRAGGLTLGLETALDVPAGARLQLVLPDGFATRAGAATPAVGADALRTLIDALLQRPSATADPGGPAGLGLPAADPGLAAGLLRWIETLRGRAGAPDAKPDADAGEPDGEPEAGALRSALGELGRQARAPLPGGWRVLVMPFGLEDPGALRLYLRDLPPDRERGPGPGRDRRRAAQRAIFEIELSQLGRCQLDVLCQTRRFDLAVRTERPLAAPLQDDIRGLLAAACALAGVAGKVEFWAAGLLTLPDPRAPAGRACIA